MSGRGAGVLLGLAPLLYVALFFLLPLGLVVLYALGYGAQGWRHLPQILAHPQDAIVRLVHAYTELFASAFYRNRIVFTFTQATLSTLVTLAAGLPLAYVFSHYRFPGRRVLRALFTAPFVLPPIVVALAILYTWGPRSWMGWDMVGLVGPLGAILIAHAYYNVGLVLRLVGTLWERIPRGLVESARSLGASPARTLWKVELPLVRPAIVASALLVFVFTATSFGIILFLGVGHDGGRVGTIETAIYDALRGFRPRLATAAALALLQLATTYAALTAFVFLQRRFRASTMPRLDPPVRRLPLAGLPVVALAIGFLLVPLGSLVAASFHYGSGWSVEPWRIVLDNRYPLGQYDAWAAVRNSLSYAGGTLALALPLALLAAFAAHRARRAAWAEALLMLPLGLSSVVIGLGLLLAWDGDPLPDLRAGRARILMAHTLIAFPFAARVVLPALQAIAPSLRETGRTLGGTAWQVARRIELPLLRPAIAVAGVFIVGTSLGEFGATLLLRRPDTTTIPLAIGDAFSRLGAPFQAQALVYAVLLVGVAAASFLLVERLRRPGGGELL